MHTSSHVPLRSTLIIRVHNALPIKRTLKKVHLRYNWFMRFPLITLCNSKMEY